LNRWRSTFGSTARIVYAEGQGGGQNSSIAMPAATHDGSWYVRIMAAPGVEWTDDGAKYFGKIKSSFRFVGKAAKH
jgi:hypothetical protein